MLPLSRGAAPPPIDTRSFISVAFDTAQPWPTRDPVGIRDPHVGQEDLVELGLPVAWRSGRTSTPGAFMSMAK